MTHNVGKSFTVSKFYNDLKTRGYQIGKDILYEYLDHIEDAFLAFAVAMDYEGDPRRLFENIVFLDLKRLGCKVNYYLTSERYEVDFLAQTRQGLFDYSLTD